MRAEGFFVFKEERIYMLETIRQDIEAVKQRDPAARSTFEVLTLYSGLHALISHRAAHWLYEKKMYYPARAISQLSRFMTGIEIHPGAKIGKRVFIDHGAGIVIGETAEIGDDCTLYQGVTLGGTGKDKGKRHPTLGKGVLVGAGAKILGPFEVGDGAKIAANAVVLKPVPPHSTAVGMPAKVVRMKDQKVDDPNVKLDHVHIPDPLSMEIRELKERLAAVEAQLAAAKGEMNNEAL